MPRRALACAEILAEQIREAIYRLLDPSDTGVTLETLSRVARALGLGLKVSLARAPSAGTRVGLRKTA